MKDHGLAIKDTVGSAAMNTVMIEGASSTRHRPNGSTLSNGAVEDGAQAGFRGCSNPSDGTSGDDRQAVGKPLIIYVDKQQLDRDCFGGKLAVDLPDWTVESLVSSRQLKEIVPPPHGLVVVLNTHGASLHTPEAAGDIAIVRELSPSAFLIVLSTLDDASEVSVAMQLGARGYLPTSLPFREAVGAIRLVGAGGTYVPASVLTTRSTERSAISNSPAGGNGNTLDLSPRQRQVLRLLLQGKQNKIIAYELNICESTVKVHVRTIMRKLKARNRTEVVFLIGESFRHIGVNMA
jgi:DNA-binding NarL/FixJ family response regulator